MAGERSDMLRQLADQGNGIHAYLDSDAEARRLFVTDLPASLVTIAQDAKVQVFFNPGAVASWRLLGYEKRALARRDFNDDRVDAGDLGAGHTVTALYELVPAGAAAPATDDPNPFVADGRPAPVREILDPSRLMRVRLRYQPPGGGDSRLLESDVADRVEAQPERETAWAAAVAGFAMLLRGDAPAGLDWDLVERLARAGRGSANPQRGEFIDLVMDAHRLQARQRR